MVATGHPKLIGQVAGEVGGVAFLSFGLASELSELTNVAALGEARVAARIAGSAERVSAVAEEDLVTLFHRGNLAGGRVLPTRALSTSTVSDLSHYAPGEALQTFKIPRAVLNQWDRAGYVTRYTDLFQGVATPEVRIEAGASGEMNKYLLPKEE